MRYRSAEAVVMRSSDAAVIRKDLSKLEHDWHAHSTLAFVQKLTFYVWLSLGEIVRAISPSENNMINSRLTPSFCSKYMLIGSMRDIT
jgi:hypothetical protein